MQIRPLIPSDAVLSRIEALSQELQHCLKNEHPVILTVRDGAVFFADALKKQIDMLHDSDDIWLKSYDGTSSTGTIQAVREPTLDLRGRHVLVVEDIVDTGRTLAWLKADLEKRGAAQVTVATLLQKKIPRDVGIHGDFVGFEIDDLFVVGCGMDWNGQYRELPYIGVLTENLS